MVPALGAAVLVFITQMLTFGLESTFDWRLRGLAWMPLLKTWRPPETVAEASRAARMISRRASPVVLLAFALVLLPAGPFLVIK